MMLATTTFTNIIDFFGHHSHVHTSNVPLPYDSHFSATTTNTEQRKKVRTESATEISPSYVNKNINNNNALILQTQQDQNIDINKNAIIYQIIMTEMYSRMKREAFTTLCNIHRNFLQTSKVFDGYLLSVAFGLFEKLQLMITQYDEDHFFSALYIAVAMEEDSEEGIHEILVHKVGVSRDFMNLAYTKVPMRHLYDDYPTWHADYKPLVSKVAKMLRGLNYNACVNRDNVLAIMQSFSSCDLFQPRQQSKLDSFTKFW